MKREFTNEDVREALLTSGTGMWRLESTEGQTPKFYGDENMDMLLGVSEDTLPEDRFKIFMSRINHEDMGKFMEYYDTLKREEQAEIVYKYDHPYLGTIYVRCGGKFASKEGNTYCYRGFHQNVTNSIRVEQEAHLRLTAQAETFRTVAYKLMENFSDAAAKINLETGNLEWIGFDENVVDERSNYNEMCHRISENVPEEYREEYLENSSLSNIKKQLEIKGAYSFSTFVYCQTDSELRRLTYWYYTINDSNDILSIYKDTTEDYLKEIQLADALVMAQQANKAKTVFLSNMSHDIRTPMNAIIGFTNLAEKYVEDETRCVDYLDKIKASSEHLLELINDVLDMSRIESGRMNLHEEPCCLKEDLENMGSILKTDSEKKGVKFTVDCSGVKDNYVVCDKLRLNQVLMNCASNAIKFTEPGGSVSVKVTQTNASLEDKKVGKYQFEIKDTGMGMSEDFLTHLFEPFSREESQVHQIQGTGLGMSICKNIVDMMNGFINVESAIGEGTCFTINLEFKLADASECGDDSGAQNEGFSLEGKRILLAEDNLLNQEIALEILGETGAIVEVANDGAEVVEKVQASKPYYFDLIIMDVQMPIMDGYEATTKIRAMDREDASDLKIIAMTANAFEEDKQMALKKGMNAHLAKPINVKEMEKTIAGLLGK